MSFSCLLLVRLLGGSGTSTGGGGVASGSGDFSGMDQEMGGEDTKAGGIGVANPAPVAPVDISSQHFTGAQSELSQAGNGAVGKLRVHASGRITLVWGSGQVPLEVSE